MLVHERRVAVVSGYAAAQVPWEVIRGLEGPTRLTRMDLCVDVVLPGFKRGPRRPHEAVNVSDTGETLYWGSPDSDLYWKLYRWVDYEKARPFLWLQQASAAGVSLEDTWRIELRVRGRRARALAQAETLAQAWAWAQNSLPSGWPETAAAETPPEEVDEALELAAEQLAARVVKYVESQARRYSRRVGLGDAAHGRLVLADIARRTLRQLQGEPEFWVRKETAPVETGASDLDFD